MSFYIEVEGGNEVILPTAGKYCDRDIVVSASDGGCSTKHFAHNFVGDGSASVSAQVPFEPDAVFIVGYSPFSTASNGAKYALASFTYDCRALGQVCGFSTYGDGNGNIGTRGYIASTIQSTYTYADGVVTIQKIHNTLPIAFYAGVAYALIATKYTDQTDRTRITDFINRLTESGTATFQLAKVTAAFTDDEWAALIATRPNWTFNLI